MISTFEKVNSVKIPYKIVGKRAGDVAASYCAVQLAKKELGWQAKYGLSEMCKHLLWRYSQKLNNISHLKFYVCLGKDAWTWQTKNPKGYQK